jgi:hypothetical protein
MLILFFAFFFLLLLYSIWSINAKNKEDIYIRYSNIPAHLYDDIRDLFVYFIDAIPMEVYRRSGG